MWYTWKMLYSVLLLRVDCLLEAARYRLFVGLERSDQSIGSALELRKAHVYE